MESRHVIVVEAAGDELSLLIGRRQFTFRGIYQLSTSPNEHILPSKETPFSFDHIVSLRGVSFLIHPSDLPRFAAYAESGGKGDFTFNLVNASLEVQRLYLKGSITSVTDRSMSSVPPVEVFDHKPNNGDLDWQAIEQDLRQHKLLLESVIQSGIVALSVLRPVTNAVGEIEDFEWVLANKLQQAISQGQKLIGKHSCDVFPKSRENGVLMSMKAAYVLGERREIEVYHKDYNIKGWLRIVAVRSGEYLIVSAEDVTAARQAEEQLRNNLSVLQQTEELADTGSWEFNSRRKALTWSEGMYKIFGLPSGTDVSPEIYIKMAAPGDEHIAEKIVGCIAVNPQPFTEIIKIRVDQKVKSIRIKATATVDANGTRVNGIDHDVTSVVELQAKERRAHAQLLAMNQDLARQVRLQYLELFHSIDQGFALMKLSHDSDESNPDLIIHQANGAFEKLIGQTEVQWRSLRDLLPGVGDEWAPVFAKIAQGGKSQRMVVPAEKVAGRYLEVFAFRSSAQTESQEVAVLLSDITERREKELQLSQLNSQLKAMNNAKTAFFNNVSHEFRTPLTLMLGPIRDLLSSKSLALSDQDLSKLQLAERNVVRLQKLVNNLLDFSRIEAGRLDTYYQPTNLDEFTNEIASGFRSIIEQAGLQYTFKSDHLTEPVYVNRDMWEKIVLNLLSNAFKFTRRGKIEVKLAEKKFRMQLSIRDTGVGISEENQKRLFQRFVRFESAEGRTVEGTGIGLSLVKELVNLHGGDIHVKSQPGKGSTFTVTIPKGTAHLPAKQIYHKRGQLTLESLSNTVLATVDEARAWLPTTRIALQNTNRSADKTHTDKPTVIVVDDNADMRQYLTEILSEEYHVIVLGTGKQAVNFLAKGYYPDLILSDIMMPDMDGYELTNFVKKNPRFSHIPLILLSARADVEDKAQGIRLGADDYIEKPFTSRELLTLVAATLEVARAHRELEIERQLKLDKSEDQVGLSNEPEFKHEVEATNDKLRNKNAEVESLNEQLLNFTFISGHDLREPLRKIRVFAHRLADLERIAAMPDAKTLVKKILGAADLMNELLEDVLKFSRTSFLPADERGQIDLNEQLERAISYHRDAIKAQKARVEYTPLQTVKANEELIQLLLQNLLSNALKYQPGHIPVINVSGYYTDGCDIENSFAAPNKSYYCLQITDNGIGFDNRYKEKIFKLFQRLHPPSEFSGTGLGLALCQKIMEKHNGFITANGSPGDGATFSCYFPVD